jgi:hypothetical protein
LDAASTARAYRRVVTSRVEHLFIVRIWYEQRGDRASQWRGSVEHVPTQTRYYFSELRALDEFVAAQAGMVERHGERTGQ